ncbi:MAG: RecX family transcriptional regulator [Bacteroidetes bacterium]|nr:RecX family transcriptional regulator [Bacteroidota bacterium]MBU1677913.1 RecX family transcriptional regulator [Bacteroidota bacterium]MBU2507886.1 RecX family transcriptional regulator [Bacteroidota bacterium]
MSRVIGLKKTKQFVFVKFDNSITLKIANGFFNKIDLDYDLELSDSQFSALKSSSEKYNAKLTAFRLLSRRQHSSFELKTKLKQRGYSERSIEEIIQELRGADYINDFKFAEDFAEEMISKKKNGLQNVLNKLRSMGINNEILAHVRELYQSYDEHEIAFELAEKKYNSISGRIDDILIIKFKIYNYLLCKGFSNEVIRKSIEKLGLS